jgi:hypothetical protein
MFGLDPQARINYGYGAITKLTPMAKNLIKAAYGIARPLPCRRYIERQCHAMIAATRLGDQYDGIQRVHQVFTYLVQPQLNSTQHNSFVVSQQMKMT